MSLFKDKTLLITGGTGSFGNAVLNRFLSTDIGEIRIFSRDEKKQDDMRHEFQAKMPEVAEKIKFYIGDVRSLESVRGAMKGVDYIFHAAALKQVPSCEFFPMEAVRTNVIGTENVLTAAIEEGVESVICLSTDKAAYPINAMGITKAIEEKVAVAKSRMSGKTKICCTRYGNVMCSRGSVIPLWIDQIKQGNPITLTEPSMTRFIMSLEEAVDLVLFAFEHGENGDLLIQKAPACTIQTQAEAVCELFGGKKEDIKIIGIRHGEKMYETLLTNEECAKAVDLGNFYRVPADNRGLNYDKYFKDGDAERNTLTEFDSNNTKLLTVEETKAKIASLSYIQEELAKMEKICPHFHLSLQSGCDATLARMNRKYTTEEYENACSILRKNFTHPAITTDVIVGFPGETEEEFAQTKEYLKRIHFYEMHIFKYSRRQGTRAAVMEHQVPEEIKTKRSAQLLALAESMSKEFRAYYVGKEEEVLFEEPMEVDGETWYTGYTKEYVKIAAKTAEPLDNVMKRGRVEAALTDEIYRMKL